MTGKLFAISEKIYIQLPEFMDILPFDETEQKFTRYFSNDLGNNLSEFLVLEKDELNEILSEFLELSLSVIEKLPKDPNAYSKIYLDTSKTKNTFILVFKLHIFQFLICAAFNEKPSQFLSYLEAFYTLDMFKSDDLYTKFGSLDDSKSRTEFLRNISTVIKELIISEAFEIQTSVNLQLVDTKHNLFNLNDIIIARLYKLSYAYDWSSMGSSHGTHYLTEFAPAFSSKSDLVDLPENEFNMVQKYTFNSLFTMIFLEFYESITRNIDIKPCKYCNRLFIPEGRSDIEYCDNIAPNENLPCSQIGATKLHYKEKEDDPVYSIFLTAYRRMRSRVRTGKLTKEEFKQWSMVARQKRDACYYDGLDISEFQTWLDSNNIN